MTSIMLNDAEYVGKLKAYKAMGRTGVLHEFLQEGRGRSSRRILFRAIWIGEKGQSMWNVAQRRTQA